MGLFRKIGFGACRIYYFIKEIPSRIVRLIRHLFSIFIILIRAEKRSWKNVLQWNVELFFLVFDLIAIPDTYEFFIDVFKSSSRPLNEKEKNEARLVFRDSIDLNRVRVDNKARIGSRKHKYAYVSFYTINLYGKLRPNLLIHELVHVWQYSHYGSAYIPRALTAQRSEMKYNYGGLESLIKTREKGLNLETFNYEQQADIVTDYYKLMNGERAQWSNATPGDLSVYQYYMKSIIGTEEEFEVLE